MWRDTQPAPPDPILGLTEAWKADPNPQKVNLGVGVYQDEQGRTPVLPSVKAAEAALLGRETTKAYLPIAGEPEYARRVEELVFGAGDRPAGGGRVRTAYAPGGTGALRVAGDLAAALGGRGHTVWLSTPTWPNHRGIFSAAGLETREYPYFHAATGSLDRDGFRAALERVPVGDLVVLHAGCHNPTGVDLEEPDWEWVAATAQARGWIPVVDAAYLGFAGTVEQDAAPLRRLLAAGVNFLVAVSFSKNMSLYRERVGALVLAAADTGSADAIFSHVKRVIRVLYSNPAAHGALTATAVLSDALLRSMWDREVAEMRARLAAVRTAFSDALSARMPDRDFGFIRRQRGLFSFTGLTPAQTTRLRERYGIYMTVDGRVNVVGLTPANLDYVADAIAETIRAVA